jgi:hypothetical protein
MKRWTMPTSAAYSPKHVFSSAVFRELDQFVESKRSSGQSLDSFHFLGLAELSIYDLDELRFAAADANSLDSNHRMSRILSVVETKEVKSGSGDVRLADCCCLNSAASRPDLVTGEPPVLSKTNRTRSKSCL